MFVALELFINQIWIYQTTLRQWLSVCLGLRRARDTGRRAQGHTDTVEDVAWRPDSAAELASVGDDHALLLWDTRAAEPLAARVTQAHGPHDLHCVDWSGLSPHLLATGARPPVPFQALQTPRGRVHARSRAAPPRPRRTGHAARTAPGCVARCLRRASAIDIMQGMLAG